MFAAASNPLAIRPSEKAAGLALEAARHAYHFCRRSGTALVQERYKSRMSVIQILSLAIVWCLAAEPFASADAHPFIAEGAKVETVAEGFKFAEGPARAPNGDLYFADFRANKILHWSIEDQRLFTITEDSHGVNGMQFDDEGRLLGCQGNKRRLVAMDATSGDVLEVLAENFGGKRFNNPNDLWIDPKGGIYFTDPAYRRNKSELELDGRHAVSRGF